MHKFLNKPIGMPQQTAIIIAASLLCCIVYLLDGKGGIVFGILCGEFACFFGPLLCAYLFFRLFCSALDAGGKHTLSFALGALFGMGTVSIWLYYFSHH